VPTKQSDWMVRAGRSRIRRGTCVVVHTPASPATAPWRRRRPPDVARAALRRDGAATAAVMSRGQSRGHGRPAARPPPRMEIPPWADRHRRLRIHARLARRRVAAGAAFPPLPPLSPALTTAVATHAWTRQYTWRGP